MVNTAIDLSAYLAIAAVLVLVLSLSVLFIVWLLKERARRRWFREAAKRAASVNATLAPRGMVPPRRMPVNPWPTTPIRKEARR